MLAPSTFRWGILGPGRIATEFATALTVVNNARLQAVASRDMSRAEEFGRRHGAVVSYGNYQQLIEDPAVDAIYIATPHRFHYELSRRCLIAGKPVLCEKPLTVNARESEALVLLAQENDVFLMEGLWTRFLPIYQEVRRWLEGGEIGTVAAVSSSFGFKFPRDPQDRMLNHDLAGGVLLDMGIYNLALSQWVFQEQPESSSIEAYIGNTNVDEQGEITLAYSSERVSKFRNSMNKQLHNDLVIYGSSGRITVHAAFWNATQATLCICDKARASNVSRSVTREFRATGFEYEIEEAMRCIHEARIESPRMTHADTLATMKLMDKLRGDMGLRYAFE